MDPENAEFQLKYEFLINCRLLLTSLHKEALLFLPQAQKILISFSKNKMQSFSYLLVFCFVLFFNVAWCAIWPLYSSN